MIAEDQLILRELANGRFKIVERRDGYKIRFDRLGWEKNLTVYYNQHYDGVGWYFYASGKNFASSTTQVKEPDPRILENKLVDLLVNLLYPLRTFSHTFF